MAVVSPLSGISHFGIVHPKRKASRSFWAMACLQPGMLMSQESPSLPQEWPPHWQLLPLLQGSDPGGVLRAEILLVPPCLWVCPAVLAPGFCLIQKRERNKSLLSHWESFLGHVTTKDRKEQRFGRKKDFPSWCEHFSNFYAALCCINAQSFKHCMHEWPCNPKQASCRTFI